MPLTDAVALLPDLPIGGNSTNGTIPVPGPGDLPAPFDILSVLTFSQTTFTLLSSLYIAWQNFTNHLKANEQLGLNIIATLNNRSDEYDRIVYRIRAINNETFYRRWLLSVPIADELRQLSAQAEKLYQLYLIKVNMAIFADADHARNGVEELQKKMDKVLELLASKSG